MKLVITEKPSVARDLAAILGAEKKGEGYIEGNGYIFTWVFGHLVQLATPDYYGYSTWSLLNLPMLPKEFVLVVRQKDKKDDSGAKKQLKIIAALLKSANEIIVATDAGREGELIFRNIYSYTKCTKPFKRLWISSQTDKAVKEGFASLKEGRVYEGLFQAARLRAESDWLVGMNATQALTLSVGGEGVYSLGRVQTPTLVLICERYFENKDFTPVVYFQIALQLDKSGIKFSALSTEKWDSMKSVEAKLAVVKTKERAFIVSVDVKEKLEAVPLLFDLTTLQQEANKKLGYSAQKTLEVAQSLYEGKLITYPRTGSRYIGDDVFEFIPSLISLLKSNARFGKVAISFADKSLNKRSVNGSKVTDHHALLITDNTPGLNLSIEQKDIYELIAGRLLEAFGESCKKEVTKVILEAGESFQANGVVILNAGWRSVFSDQSEEEDDWDGELPKLFKGDFVKILKSESLQKQTVPKALLSEATLLKAMETCGREIEDEDAREAMKESGLGTAGTRAQIITILFDRGYIVRQKKSLVPTEKGLVVFGLVKDKVIGKPIMTGEWEKLLAKVERGNMPPKEFEVGITGYTKMLVEELTKLKIKTMENSNVESMKCPKCLKGTISFVNRGTLDGAVCSEKREDCGFIVFRTIAKKKLLDGEITSLILDGKTKKLEGFISTKTSKPFSAKLKLDDAFKVVFEFENNPKSISQ